MTALKKTINENFKSHQADGCCHFNGKPRTTRVSAVWKWNDGKWKEAHHHESFLSAE